jgi:hypothetical protein
MSGAKINLKAREYFGMTVEVMSRRFYKQEEIKK